MNNYELMTIAKVTLNDQGAKDLSKQIQESISSLGGKVGKNDFWGKRKLAYELNGQTEGYYDVLQFSLSPASVSKLEKKLNLFNDLLRYIVSAKS